MKIITRAVFQMTADGYELLEEESHEHCGLVSEAKGSTLSSVLMPAGELFKGGTDGAGFTDAGGALNHFLDPGDLFGGDETAAAKKAQKDLPGQLSALNELQANVSRYNTSGPFGESKWTIDPTTGRYTQTTNLSPSEQKQFDVRNQVAEAMLGKAKEWSPDSSSDFNYSADVPAIANQQYAKTQSLMSPVADANSAAWRDKMANAGVSSKSDAYKEVAAQRGANAGTAEQQAYRAATTAAIPLAQQQRQQRMSEMAQLIGSEQLNSPAQGGTGVDINGATSAANAQGIANANQQAAQRNANMQALTGLLKAGSAYGGS